MKSVLVSWLSSIGVGLATAVIAAVVGGWIANRAVSWYHVSSFEGKSGYFVVFQSLYAFVIAFVIGVIISRVIVNGGGTQLKAALIAQVVSLTLLVVIGGVSRALADVPPTIDGASLMLAVEVSWPEATAPTVAAGDSLPFVALSAMSGQSVRTEKQGPLWLAEARRADGRVIVPGAVAVFTGRGKRMLTINTGRDDDAARFLLPLPGSPGAAEREWSGWLPKAREGSPALPDGIRYRFRVVTSNESLRTEIVGPFTISTIVRDVERVTYSGRPPVFESDARFEVTYQGQPVSVLGREGDMYVADSWSSREDAAKRDTNAAVTFEAMSAVAIIPAPTVALVVQMSSRERGSYCFLLQPDGARVRTTFISLSRSMPLAARLSPQSDTAPSTGARVHSGDIDHTTFVVPGLYLLANAVLDTRTLTVQATALPQLSEEPGGIGPFSLSPDERRYARLGRSSSPLTVEEVTIASSEVREVSAGFAVSPTGLREDIDRAWFDHYFTWQPGSGGEHRLVPRPNTLSMPHRGTLTEQPGYREYRINRASESLRDAVIAELVGALHATVMPTAEDAYAREITLDGQTFNVGFTDGTIAIWMERNGNTLPVVRIARHLDSVLATRRFDRHFVSDSTP